MQCIRAVARDLGHGAPRSGWPGGERPERPLT
jgi:hypothetical protein